MLDDLKIIDFSIGNICKMLTTFISDWISIILHSLPISSLWFYWDYIKLKVQRFGQNAGVHSLSLLQGVFPTQGSNPGLPHDRQILYQLSYQGTAQEQCRSKNSWEELPHVQGKRNTSKMVGAEKGHQTADRLKPQSQTSSHLITWRQPCLTQWK